jgi:hypothetical protein
MPEGDLTGLRNRLVADVATLVSKRRPLTIQLVCDGAPEMWGLLEEGFTPEKFPKTPLNELVDLHHLMEKLVPAAQLLDGPAAPQKVVAWKLALLNRHQAAASILTELTLSGKQEVRVGQDQPVHEAITYLTHHSQDADRMNYCPRQALGVAPGQRQRGGHVQESV